jgi:hypothetical protein
LKGGREEKREKEKEKSQKGKSISYPSGSACWEMKGKGKEK